MGTAVIPKPLAVKGGKEASIPALPAAEAAEMERRRKANCLLAQSITKEQLQEALARAEHSRLKHQGK